MVKRNVNFTRFGSTYLFPEINARKRKFLEVNPLSNLISLGIGDTTEPLPFPVAQALSQTAAQLGTREGYAGYGSEQGLPELRQAIAAQLYSNLVKPEEVFISDGAKCDIGRLQLLFGKDVSIAVQDPSYPVYVDGSIIQGVTEIVFLDCLPQNDFFPDLVKSQRTNLIYFCSPNNPTGAAATRAQLAQLVEFAKKNRSIILFDAAYASYIQDPGLPKSIYEIPGSREVALEINSFSKLAGFTGVRLGWTIIPEELKYEDGASVKADWNRLMQTIFNGASNISQKGGVAVLEKKGMELVKAQIAFYLMNANLLKRCLESMGVPVYGGIHAPYLWAQFKGRKSWDIFQEFLEKAQVVTTPGSGFGPGGEGFLRLSAFGRRDNIVKAVDRILKSGIA